MGSFCSPRVYMVGWTTVDREALLEYLKFTGNESFIDMFDEVVSSGIHPGEALCSFMAKLCYKSLSEGKNDNISKVRNIEDNFASILSSAHGSVLEHVNVSFVATNVSRVCCYTPEAQILTFAGWKLVTDLIPSDLLLTKDQATSMCRWSPILELKWFDYKGEVYRVSNSQYKSPGMTPDHIMWASQYDLRRNRGLSNREIADKFSTKIMFSEIFGKRFVIDRAISMEFYIDQEIVSIGEHKYDAYDLVSWLGWMATDGNFTKDRPNQSTISQKKPKNLRKIEVLMNNLFGDRWRRHGPYDNGAVSFTISDKDVTQWAKEQIGPNKIERNFSEWIMSLHPRLLRGFYRSAVDGDGNVHQKNGHEVIYCTSQRTADQWQIILSNIGLSGNIRVDDRVGYSHFIGEIEVETRRLCWIVSVSRKSASLVKKKHQSSSYYQGKVFCPRTDDGLVFVRGTGLPFWSGNTHEQVRHRLGNYSQTSGRYVRGDSFDIVWDPILQPVELTARHLHASIENVYREMVNRMGLNGRQGLIESYTEHKMDGTSGNLIKVPPTAEFIDNRIKELGVDPDNLSFSYKKKATSALRRFLPNGISNEIGFTYNLRTIRHVVQVRTSRHAEAEIRDVFGQVYKLVKAKFPLIFSDAKEAIVDGFLEITGMRMQPYDLQLEDVVKTIPDEVMVAELNRRNEVTSEIHNPAWGELVDTLREAIKIKYGREVSVISAKDGTGSVMFDNKVSEFSSKNSYRNLPQLILIFRTRAVVSPGARDA